MSQNGNLPQIGWKNIYLKPPPRNDHLNLTHTIHGTGVIIYIWLIFFKGLGWSSKETTTRKIIAGFRLWSVDLLSSYTARKRLQSLNNNPPWVSRKDVPLEVLGSKVNGSVGIEPQYTAFISGL